jgi:hypothetical protein
MRRLQPLQRWLSMNVQRTLRFASSYFRQKRGATSSDPSDQQEPTKLRDFGLPRHFLSPKSGLISEISSFSTATGFHTLRSAVPLASHTIAFTIRPGFDVPLITPIVPRGSKTLRAQLVAPMFEAGKVFFSADCPLLPVLIDELISTSNSVHDDAMDSLTQAVAHMRDIDTEPPPFTVLRQELVPGLNALLAHANATGQYEPNPAAAAAQRPDRRCAGSRAS